MTPNFFKTPLDFRKWLVKNHLTKKELIVGYYKKESGKPSINWPESVDQALCFGWIDGIRRSIDKESYCIRFTPRKEKSIWSAVNLKKVEDLMAKNLMAPAGLKIYKKRDPKKERLYSFEQEKPAFNKKYLQKFKTNKSAYDWFIRSAPSYQKAAVHWVMSAKQELTQWKRLDELIKDSENKLRIKSMRRNG